MGRMVRSVSHPARPAVLALDVGRVGRADREAATGARWEPRPLIHGRASHPNGPPVPAAIGPARLLQNAAELPIAPPWWEADPLTTGQAPTRDPSGTLNGQSFARRHRSAGEIRACVRVTPSALTKRRAGSLATSLTRGVHARHNNESTRSGGPLWLDQTDFHAPGWRAPYAMAPRGCRWTCGNRSGASAAPCCALRWLRPAP